MDVADELTSEEDMVVEDLLLEREPEPRGEHAPIKLSTGTDAWLEPELEPEPEPEPEPKHDESATAPAPPWTRLNVTAAPKVKVLSWMMAHASPLFLKRKRLASGTKTPAEIAAGLRNAEVRKRNVFLSEHPQKWPSNFSLASSFCPSTFFDMHKNRTFAKTGSGQAKESTHKRVPVFFSYS
jgi:hypothetical protein